MGRSENRTDWTRASRLIDIQVGSSPISPTRGRNCLDDSPSQYGPRSTAGSPRPRRLGSVRPWPRWPLGPARVVHLHRRAGFAATWRELQRDLSSGPDASIDRLLSGTARGEGVPTDFAAIADKLVESGSKDIGRLQAWWVYRMVAGPDPLGERLALFWHDHFATSAGKVGPLVRRQNEIFREFARALTASCSNASFMTRPCSSGSMPMRTRAGSPMRTWRELMELFTIGVGNYTETDVKEAARVLTGWTVEDGRLNDDPLRHDDGEKTVLAHRGRWHGDDLIAMLIDHPATARRLAERICRLLLGEASIPGDDVAALAAGMRERNLDVGWAVETVLRLRRFFAREQPGPAHPWASGVRRWGCPCPGGVQPASQHPGPGRVGRVVGAESVLSTERWRLGGRPRLADDAERSAVRVCGRPRRRTAHRTTRAGRCPSSGGAHGRDGGLGDQVAFFAELVTGRSPSPAWRDQIVAAVTRSRAAQPEAARRAITLILASPLAQLA